MDFLCAHGFCPDFQTILEGMKDDTQWSLRTKLDALAAQGWINPARTASSPIVPTRKVFDEQWRVSPRGSTKPAAASPSATEDEAQTAGESSDRDYILPLSGRIAAGQPIETFQQEGFISLADLVGRKDVYVLEVNGNSMIEDHIANGDYVVVEKCNVVQDGEIAVALINGYETTLKRLNREEDAMIRLQPANISLLPILVPADRVSVQGRVVAVLRRF